MNLKHNLIFSLLVFLFTTHSAFAFIKITDLVFDGESVNPDDLSTILETIEVNKKKNIKKQQNGSTMLLPTQLQIIEAMLLDPKNIQIEIDTSDVLVRTNDDIQEPISNVNFFNAVSEAISLWDSVDIADVSFLPLNSGPCGRNIVPVRSLARQAKPPKNLKKN